MQTKEHVEQAFRSELQALLKKHDAEISAEEHWEGYAECGSDVRITVTIPSKLGEDGEYLREYTEIDLGTRQP